MHVYMYIYTHTYMWVVVHGASCLATDPGSPGNKDLRGHGKARVFLVTHQSQIVPTRNPTGMIQILHDP